GAHRLCVRGRLPVSRLSAGTASGAPAFWFGAACRAAQSRPFRRHRHRQHACFKLHLYSVSRHGGSGGGPAGANQSVRRHRRAVLSAQRRRGDHAHHWRSGSAIRRARGSHRLSGGARLACRPQPGLLAILVGPGAGPGGVVRQGRARGRGAPARPAGGATFAQETGMKPFSAVSPAASDFAAPDAARSTKPFAGASAPVVLETRKLCLSFGALKVTRDVDFQLRSGERHALIGSNGAGKSTLVNLLAGALQPQSGDILLNGERINKLASFQRVRRGLVRTFQITALFGEMTPLDSVALAVCQANGAGLSFMGASAAHAAAVDEAAEILRTVGLLDHARDETRFMAYGHQRLLEIALALACRPRVLLLDEPAAGVPMAESRRLFQTLAELPDDLAILLIEHDMKLVFQFASRISVLAEGALLAQGTPQEIAHDERVRQSYLGHSHA